MGEEYKLALKLLPISRQKKKKSKSQLTCSPPSPPPSHKAVIETMTYIPKAKLAGNLYSTLVNFLATHWA